MTSRNFKAATLAGAAVALTALLLAYPALVSPAAATTSTTTTTSTASNTSSSTTGQWQGPQGPQGFGGQGYGGQQPGGPGGLGQYQQQKVNVTDGETFTVTSTTGQYRVVGDSDENGTASGTITFTVTGSLTEGDTLSISGTVVIDGTTYTISSGSAQLNPSATSISGQGTTTPTGTFILQATAHGSFVGSNGQVSLDFSNGTTEYLVSLAGNVAS